MSRQRKYQLKEYRLVIETNVHTLKVLAKDIQTGKTIFAIAGLYGFITSLELEEIAIKTMKRKGYQARQMGLHESIEPIIPRTRK